MEIVIIVAVIGIIVMSGVAFFVGKKSGHSPGNVEKILFLESQLADLTHKNELQRRLLMSKLRRL